MMNRLVKEPSLYAAKHAATAVCNFKERFPNKTCAVCKNKSPHKEINVIMDFLLKIRVQRQ